MHATQLDLYLLTVRGRIREPDLEAARGLHNATAGAAANVAAARSLGDLSHAVYTSLAGEPELLFVEIWNRLDGLARFFEDPRVQERAHRLFATHDAVVWQIARGYASFSLPEPARRSARFISLARGRVITPASAREVINAAVAGGITEAWRLGQLSHAIYTPVMRAGLPSDELLGVGVWTSHDGMIEYHGRPHLEEMMSVFKNSPATSLWRRPNGMWVEW